MKTIQGLIIVIVIIVATITVMITTIAIITYIGRKVSACGEFNR